MKHITKLYEAGFSLLEMLCAFSIFSVVLIIAINFYAQTQRITSEYETGVYKRYQKQLVINKIGECLMQAVTINEPEQNQGSALLDIQTGNGQCVVAKLISNGEISGIDITFGDKKFEYRDEWLVGALRRSSNPIFFIRRQESQNEVLDAYLLDELLLTMLVR
jgi:prepilin-type N-terminal cleavage/methylation domain-containing protein